MIQKLLDSFYYGRRWAAAAVAFLSIRLFGVEVTFSDVKHGKYPLRKFVPLNLDDSRSLDDLLSIAEECHERAETRRLHVADKCKTLLTVTSLSIALIGFLLPRSLTWEAWWMQLMFFFAIAALINAIFLLLVLFAVGAEEFIDLKQDKVALSESDLKKYLINSRLKCESSLDDRTDYQVDVYATARFFFLSGFLIIAALVSLSVLSQNSGGQTADLIRSIRADDKLITLLRGPQGVRGDAGKSATIDEILSGIESSPEMINKLRGIKGDKGDKGDSPVPLNERDVVDRILQNPAFKRLDNNAPATIPAN